MSAVRSIIALELLSTRCSSLIKGRIGKFARFKQTEVRGVNKEIRGFGLRGRGLEGYNKEATQRKRMP